MSGHSKWANIKHRKAAQDKKRGKDFARAIRAIEVAAKEAGTSDPDQHAGLGLAVQKAKQASVPKDTIERACKRGAGQLGDASDYQSVQYEGYAPGGVAVLVDCLTDNRNRASGDVRHAFSKVGGSLANPGSVAYLFRRRGQVLLATGASEDDIMMAGLDAGLEAIEDTGDGFVAWCDPSDAKALSDALAAAGLEVADAGSTMVADLNVAVEDVTEARRILRLMDLLDDCDDVQDVYANFDMSDEVMAEAAQ